MTVDCVLDTSALIAVIRGEPGAQTVRERLKNERCVMHALNVAEFCFTASRRQPEHFTPDSAMAWFAATEMGMVHLLDAEFIKLTAHVRLTVRALSVGDGVAVALASVLNASVLTAERSFKQAHEYARIELIR